MIVRSTGENIVVGVVCEDICIIHETRKPESRKKMIILKRNKEYTWCFFLTCEFDTYTPEPLLRLERAICPNYLLEILSSSYAQRQLLSA
jgi:hypothetical protein